MKQNKLFIFVRTIISYFLGGIVGIFCFIPVLILVAILPNKYRYDNKVLFWFLDLTYRGVCAALFLKITIRGKENIPQEPAIFIANHQSSLDIPVLGLVPQGHPHIWLVFVRFAKTPVLGFFVRRMTAIVDPETSISAARSLLTSVRLIKDQNRHVLLFPEGGRFIDGEVHDFFRGFVILAKQTGRPVVPVLLRNLGKVYPPHSFLIYRYPVEMLIGAPLRIESEETDEQFAQRAYAWFVENNK